MVTYSVLVISIIVSLTVGAHIGLFIMALLAISKDAENGKWVSCGVDHNDMEINECSECGRKQFGYSNYCPSCGAKMQRGDSK